MFVHALLNIYIYNEIRIIVNVNIVMINYRYYLSIGELILKGQTLPINRLFSTDVFHILRVDEQMVALQWNVRGVIRVVIIINVYYWLSIFLLNAACVQRISY